MKKVIDLRLNYFDHKTDMNDLMKQEFYAAKKFVFSLRYPEYYEEQSLPLSPKDHNVFYPLATYRVKTARGNFKWINIYAQGLGGMIITDEI